MGDGKAVKLRDPSAFSKVSDLLNNMRRARDITKIRNNFSP